MSLAGLILAAGASSRMGRPKALLEIGGETFLDRLILSLSAACSPVMVVLGHDAEAIRGGVRRAELASFVTNPDPERGQLSSLQCGLRAAPAASAGVIFTPVDCPLIRPSTVAALAAAYRARQPEALVAVPRHQERRGHPVLVAASLIPEFLALPAGAQAREVVRRHADQVLQVDVDDPGILADVDEPASYERLLEGKAP